MSVPLSVLSTGLHLLNAAGFIMLAPGSALADYISASVLYGIVSWVCLWVLPSVFEYRADRMHDLRSLQATLAAGGVLVLLLTHPNTIGLLFALLLAVEVAAFLPHLMLYEERTATFVRADFSRGCLNSLALLTAVLLFERQPVAYVAGLVLSLTTVAGTMAATGVPCAPLPRLRLDLRLLRVGLRAALTSLQFRQLMGARLIEAATVLSLNFLGLLGPILALKLGNAAVQAAAFNARRLSVPGAIVLGTLLYAAGMVVILAANALAPALAPRSLQLIGPGEALVVVPPLIAMLVLTVLSIRPRGHTSSVAAAR
ncbi:hypothetical protein [Thermaurantiacus tibetensis]|uniref:hypothetical protein n=1 Tax=Thermaurantiacus tibetensis TaxID=2759035 RepID=UPI00188F482F|nr:hypothetical protein [Thermaurantiacus tibetensis]